MDASRNEEDMFGDLPMLNQDWNQLDQLFVQHNLQQPNLTDSLYDDFGYPRPQELQLTDSEEQTGLLQHNPPNTLYDEFRYPRPQELQPMNSEEQSYRFPNDALFGRTDPFQQVSQDNTALQTLGQTRPPITFTGSTQANTGVGLPTDRTSYHRQMLAMHQQSARALNILPSQFEFASAQQTAPTQTDPSWQNLWQMASSGAEVQGNFSEVNMLPSQPYLMSTSDAAMEYAASQDFNPGTSMPYQLPDNLRELLDTPLDQWPDVCRTNSDGTRVNAPRVPTFAPAVIASSSRTPLPAAATPAAPSYLRRSSAPANPAPRPTEVPYRGKVASRNCIDCNKKFRPTMERTERCRRHHEQFQKNNSGPGMCDFDPAVSSFAAAQGLIYPATPPVQLKDDRQDDVLTCKLEEDDWIKRLLAAVNTVYSAQELSGDETIEVDHEHYSRQQVTYNRKPHQETSRMFYTPVAINARLRMLFKAVIVFHEGGVWVYPAGGDNNGYGDSNLLTCSERLEMIERILRKDKRIVMDVVEGRGVCGLAGNPKKYAERKKDNHKCNGKKRDRLARADEIVGAGGEKVAEEGGDGDGEEQEDEEEEEYDDGPRKRRRTTREAVAGPSTVAPALRSSKRVSRVQYEELFGEGIDEDEDMETH